jgi:hypothetical protein
MSTHLLSRAPLRVLAALGVALLGAACGDDNITAPLADSPATFNQVQRLGNPLVSEVLLMKRDHAFHGSIGPDQDVTAFSAKVKGFVAAFRPSATGLQNAIAATLLPDMLVIDTSQPQSTAGYLSYVLSGTGKGYGGRKLTDDVVDISLSAVFSDLLDPTQAACKPFQLPLCTDNVPTHSALSTGFPYLATPK